MKVTNELKAGIFVSICLATFVAMIWILGSERQIFSEQEVFYTAFRDIGGLSEGAPVRLGGITVGRVQHIGFSKDMDDPNVHIKLLINKKYLDRIREDSKISISTQGLLGDKFLSVSTGISGMGSIIKPGSVISSSAPADTAEVFSSLSEGAKSIASIAAKMERGDGFMGKLLGPQSDQFFTSLEQSLSNIEAISAKINQGQGLLGKIIYDPSTQDTFKAIDKAAQSLAKASENISQISQTVIEGQGILHQLIYNPAPDTIENIKEMSIKLNQTADALKKTAEALASGQGTLGALIVDPSLYENLVQVTDEAKRSTLLKYAIRSSLKK